MARGRAQLVAPLLAGLLAVATPAAARILVIGDSNALGIGVLPQWAWTNILQRSVDQFVQVYGAPGMSVAFGGFGIGQTPTCIQNNVGLFPPTLAIFALGTNDHGSNIEDVRTATRATLGAVPVPWICITPPHLRDDDHMLDAVRAVIADECTTVGAVIVDGARLITDADLSDGTHLDRRGHAKLARAVAAIVHGRRATKR